MDTLKRIARQTVGTVLHHIPIVHLPTFQLHTAPVSVTFAICTLGSPVHAALMVDMKKNLTKKSTPTRDSLVKKRSQARDDWIKGKGVIAPVVASDQIMELEENPTEEEAEFEQKKQLVHNEKSAMMYNVSSRYSAGITE